MAGNRDTSGKKQTSSLHKLNQLNPSNTGKKSFQGIQNVRPPVKQPSNDKKK